MKRIIKLTFAAAFAAVAGYGVYANQNSEAMSDIMLANVEALASGESQITCEYDPGDTCRVGSTDVKDWDEKSNPWG